MNDTHWKHNKWWIIGCIVFGVLFYTLPMTPLGYMISKKETLTNRIMMKIARQITAEKHLYLVGTGAQMMNEIQMLALSFDGFRDISLDEARELIVYAVETFVNEVNANEKIRPYLANYPFTAVLKKSYWVAKIEPFCVHAVDSGRQPVLPKVRQNGSHPHLI